MKRPVLLSICALVAVAILWTLSGCQPARTPEKQPLTSWNDGPAKESIVGYVTRVTQPGGEEFIPEADRIAVFDNDGTLWCEQPLYFEMVYSLKAAESLLAAHPELATKPELKALTDQALLAKDPEKGIETAFVLTHATEAEAFAENARAWLDTAVHPRFRAKYTELTYRPMVELLDYLRENGFTTYIVSGGSSAFIRQFSDPAYGIPPQQVVGTMLKGAFVAEGGHYQVAYLPEIWHNNDNVGKPVGIEQLIGKRPVLAFGNSDGDLQMLQYASGNSYPSLCLLLHHTDAEREYAYDSLSTIGTLRKALVEGQQKGWTIVDMKNDWNQVFTGPAQ